MLPLEAELGVLHDRRGSPRRCLRLMVPSVRSTHATEVWVYNLSVTGLMVESKTHLLVGEMIELDLPEASKTVAEVIWSVGDNFGCQFTNPISDAVINAALLRGPALIPEGNVNKSAKPPTRGESRIASALMKFLSALSISKASTGPA